MNSRFVFLVFLVISPSSASSFQDEFSSPNKCIAYYFGLTAYNSYGLVIILERGWVSLKFKVKQDFLDTTTVIQDNWNDFKDHPINFITGLFTNKNTSKIDFGLLLQKILNTVSTKGTPYLDIAMEFGRQMWGQLRLYPAVFGTLIRTTVECLQVAHA